MKVAWGITGSGDFMPEIIQTMKKITQEQTNISLYVFLSKAAEKVIIWYGLERELALISNKVFLEVDSNTTKPFYYIPGALQLGKFKFFLVCPATANTVAKIVNGIADTLITNSVAQASKANIPIYILPVDNKRGKQTTILPSGDKLELEMRDIDLENTARLSRINNVHVFEKPEELGNIFKQLSKI